MPRSTFASSIVLAVGFLTVWLGMACQNVCHAEDVYLAFWNVENLFDTEDNPNEEGDEDFTPTGVKKWTEERLTRKISNLSRVIRAMNDDRGPDILGLAEVENQKMAELLAAQMTVKPHRYKVVHRDSPSRRGIDCAIVYDEAKFTLKSSQFFTIDGTEQPTRMIVEAELADAQGGKLFVFANHWPSRAHPESDRILAAKVLRKRVDEILKADANADFVAFGDFNDFADDPALVETLLTVEKPADAKEGKLLNATWPLFRRGEGSYVYQNKWETIDLL
jgi:endonuclease/exonuclease/phosphatase family metal-dependent hydrolase